jgi:PhzF family phenazine biosynthesis protein
MDFPSRPGRLAEPPPGLAAALGLPAVECHASVEDLLVVLDGEAEVRAVRPDFALLRAIPVRGTIVTAPAGPESGADFVSRFFAPRLGIDEDPVTGSAHCVLAPYWSARFARRELVARQVSARGGTVLVRHEGARVALGGRAVTVFRAELERPPALA